MRNPWKNKYQMLRMNENARHMAQTGAATEVVEILKTLTPRRQMKILKIEGLTDDLIKAGYEPFDRRMRGIPEAGMLMKKARERQVCIPCRIFRASTIKLMNLCSDYARLIDEVTKRHPDLPIDAMKATINPRWVTKKSRRKTRPPSPGQ